MKCARQLFLFIFTVVVLITSGQAAQTSTFQSMQLPPLDWTPCPLITGQSTRDAFCSKLLVPLNWDNPLGRKIPIFVKKYVGPDQSRPHRQVWLIEGGPGTASAINEPNIRSWVEHDPATDVYIRDHRGVGDSFGLFCPKTEGATYGYHNPLPPEKWLECLNEILNAPAGTEKSLTYEELMQFNATNAAKDLFALIENTRLPGQKVNIIGSSYGTMLVQRYLQIAPDQADAVILDGTGALGVSSLLRWDDEHDRIGFRILEFCSQDPFCSSKFFAAFGATSTPQQVLTSVLKKALANGQSCGDIPYERLRAALAIMVDVSGIRDLIPALIYRLARCSPEDLVAIRHMKKSFFGALTGGGSNTFAARSSEVLQNIIISSEIALVPKLDPEDNSSLIAEAQSRHETFSFTAGMSLLFTKIYALGIKYPRDSYFGQFAPRTKPLLILNGTLDPSTPIEGAIEIASHYKNPNQFLVPIPWAGHVTLGNPCASSIGHAFLDHPTRTPDISCLDQVPAIQFIGSEHLARALFDQPDAWENPKLTSCEAVVP